MANGNGLLEVAAGSMTWITPSFSVSCSAGYTTRSQPPIPTAPKKREARQQHQRDHRRSETPRHIPLWMDGLLSRVGDSLDRQIEPDGKRYRRERALPAVWPGVGQKLVYTESRESKQREQEQSHDRQHRHDQLEGCRLLHSPNVERL